MPRLCAIVVLLCLQPAAFAQSGEAQTNMDVLSGLASTCLPGAGGLTVVTLKAPSRLPFLGSAMVSTLTAQGVTVLSAAEPLDSTAALLDIDLERAGVTYQRDGSGWLTRTVSLALAVQLTADSREILHDELCTPSATDRIRRDAVPGLEESAYPETRGTVPLSLWRRAVQPAMITLATAAGTVLFFSLRSRRSDGS
jgi:hypothetical protein